MARDSCCRRAWASRARRSRRRCPRDPAPARRCRPESSQLGDGYARAPLVPGAEPELSHPCVLLQHLRHALPKRARALAVNDSQCWKVGANGVVERLQYDAIQLVGAQSPNVHLAASVNFGQITVPCNGNRRLIRFEFRQRVEWHRELQGTDRDLRFVATDPEHAAGLVAERRDPHQVSSPGRFRRFAPGSLRWLAPGFLVLGVQLGQNRRLTRREILCMLARGPRFLVELVRAGLLQVSQRAFDFRAGVEQVLSGFLARLAFDAALPLAHIALALEDVVNAPPGILEK